MYQWRLYSDPSKRLGSTLKFFQAVIYVQRPLRKFIFVHIAAKHKTFNSFQQYISCSFCWFKSKNFSFNRDVVILNLYFFTLFLKIAG